MILEEEKLPTLPSSDQTDKVLLKIEQRPKVYHLIHLLKCDEPKSQNLALLYHKNGICFVVDVDQKCRDCYLAKKKLFSFYQFYSCQKMFSG